MKSPREKEKEVVARMIHMWSRHTGKAEEGEELLRYALARLDRCPSGDDKPSCRRCPHHCYKPEMRERIKSVMRYAAPRMLLRAPLFAIKHLLP